MKKLHPEEEEILGDSSFETLKGASKKSHWILWLSVSFMLIMLIWSYFGELDETTLALGKVIPSQKVKVVQYFEGGRIKDILVEEGDSVKEGQVLMNIDDTRFSSDYRESYARALALQAKMARLKAMVEDKDFIVPEHVTREYPHIVANEIALYKAKQYELEAEIDILENQKIQREKEVQALQAKEKKLMRSFDLVDKELKMTEPLVKEGAVSQVELLRLQRVANDLSGDLTTVRLEIPKVESQIQEAIHKIRELKLSIRTESLDELTSANSELSSLRASNISLKDRLQRTSIVSPVTGTIKQIHVNTRGGVVSPGMNLIEIVPTDDTLLIEARVNPSDIAFLRPGQDASVKISAYDYSIYGTLPATLEHISADTTTDEEGKSYYEIWVRTERNFVIDKKTGDKLLIFPGMNASVSIITGHKTVLQYILKPIIKGTGGAMHER